jgi:hypothetical protein
MNNELTNPAPLARIPRKRTTLGRYVRVPDRFYRKVRRTTPRLRQKRFKR